MAVAGHPRFSCIRPRLALVRSLRFVCDAATSQVQALFSIFSIVNFNTDMFRLPCLFGSSQPISKALATAASPFIALALVLAIMPLITTVCSRYHGNPTGQPRAAKTLEELCALSNNGEGHFRPLTAYGVAAWREAVLICFAVSVPLGV